MYVCGRQRSDFSHVVRGLGLMATAGFLTAVGCMYLCPLWGDSGATLGQLWGNSGATLFPPSGPKLAEIAVRVFNFQVLYGT